MLRRGIGVHHSGGWDCSGQRLHPRSSPAGGVVRAGRCSAKAVPGAVAWRPAGQANGVVGGPWPPRPSLPPALHDGLSSFGRPCRPHASAPLISWDLCLPSAGLLPILKEIIELLFQEGLLKVNRACCACFAIPAAQSGTEVLAVMRDFLLRGRRVAHSALAACKPTRGSTTKC